MQMSWLGRRTGSRVWRIFHPESAAENSSHGPYDKEGQTDWGLVKRWNVLQYIFNSSAIYKD